MNNSVPGFSSPEAWICKARGSTASWISCVPLEEIFSEPPVFFTCKMGIKVLTTSLECGLYVEEHGRHGRRVTAGSKHTTDVSCNYHHCQLSPRWCGCHCHSWAYSCLLSAEQYEGESGDNPGFGLTQVGVLMLTLLRQPARPL